MVYVVVQPWDSYTAHVKAVFTDEIAAKAYVKAALGTDDDSGNRIDRLEIEESELNPKGYW